MTTIINLWYFIYPIFITLSVFVNRTLRDMFYHFLSPTCLRKEHRNVQKHVKIGVKPPVLGSPSVWCWWSSLWLLCLEPPQAVPEWNQIIGKQFCWCARKVCCAFWVLYSPSWPTCKRVVSSLAPPPDRVASRSFYSTPPSSSVQTTPYRRWF